MQNYKIDQAYVSQSVADFDWLSRLNLSHYNDIEQPALFIGMYSDDDLVKLYQHQNKALVLWCGYDAKMVQDFEFFKMPHIKNLVGSVLVQKHLQSKEINAIMTPPMMVHENIYQGISGNKVFAYCPETSNDYHRIDLIKKLKKYHILSGRNRYTQKQWHDGVKYKVYNRCYIGLVLNDFSGGAQTIMELAMQGKYCVTNVMNLSNCLPWETLNDIKRYLTDPKYRIPDPEIAAQNNFYNFEPEWLNLNYYD